MKLKELFDLKWKNPILMNREELMTFLLQRKTDVQIKKTANQSKGKKVQVKKQKIEKIPEAIAALSPEEKLEVERILKIARESASVGLEQNFLNKL